MGETDRRRAVTMDDVAREAGVSRSTVSLVLRESPLVSDARRARVLDTARRLGYTRNRLASRLASRRTGTIGVFLLTLHNTLFADIHDGIAEALRDTAYHLIVAVGPADRESAVPKHHGERASIRSLVDVRVDGLLLAGFIGDPETLPDITRGTPTVVITRQASAPGVDSVFADDHAGAELAVEHLSALGHRRIVHIANSTALPYGGRRCGYISTMRRHGLTPSVHTAAMTERGGIRAMREILARPGPPPTAVFAHNDLVALGALAALAESGLHVPADISVVGYDATAVAASAVVGLTSVDQHGRELGRLAAAQLLARLDGAGGGTPLTRTMPELIVRRTSGPVPGDVRR